MKTNIKWLAAKKGIVKSACGLYTLEKDASDWFLHTPSRRWLNPSRDLRTAKAMVGLTKEQLR